MIPYITIPPFHIWGPIGIQPFGVLVVTGCIVGYLVARWHASSVGLEATALRGILFWVLVPAFVFSQLISLGLDHPELVLGQRPTRHVGATLSSYGGLFGGALCAVVYFRRKGLDVWRYTDCLVLGLTVGWFFGRLGCTIVHDHPGIRSDFILAVQYPSGARHDLGLYEWLFTIGLILLLLVVRTRKPAPGTILGLICVLYAPVRFGLDFLRINDKLYFGLTAGQYFSVALLAIGVWVLMRTRRRFGYLFQ